MVDHARDCPRSRYMVPKTFTEAAVYAANHAHNRCPCDTCRECREAADALIEQARQALYVEAMRDG